jgi:hypothetical protein
VYDSGELRTVTFNLQINVDSLLGMQTISKTKTIISSIKNFKSNFGVVKTNWLNFYLKHEAYKEEIKDPRNNRFVSIGCQPAINFEVNHNKFNQYPKRG